MSNQGKTDLAQRFDGIAVFLFAAILFGITSHGAIRSPDSEIVYRLAESIAHEGRIDIEEGLSWQNFGWAKGKDGKKYPIFGLGQSLALVPFIWLGDIADALGLLPSSPPISYYVKNGLAADFGFGEAKVEDFRPHALRIYGALLNVLAGAMCVWFFRRLLLRLGLSRWGAMSGAAIFATSSLVWPYSVCYFSEILATMFVTASFSELVRADGDESGHGRRFSYWAGFYMGLAVLTHITAVLFVPFMLLSRAFYLPLKMRRVLKSALWVGLGLLIPLLFLMIYNAVRFSSPFETGRSVDPVLSNQLGYGVFTWPLNGFYGLLASSGKGLWVYMPLSLLSLFVWRSFHKKFPGLSSLILLSFAARIVFISMRSDWHGGFALGPRYLVMLAPLLTLPVAFWLDSRLKNLDFVRRSALALLLLLLIMQQAYFTAFEEFRFYFATKFGAESRQIDLWTDDAIYTESRFSPLLHISESTRGPWLWRDLPLGDMSFVLIVSLLAALFPIYCLRRLRLERFDTA